jgi:uncharacterized RDD family membrane protein YckC
MKELTLRANPYIGLRPFLEGDSLYFFGRGQQSAELLEILHQQRFLGVVGSSGSGKSSLVRAGLLSKLLGGFLVQDRDRWRIVRMKPGDAPIANLVTALFEAIDQPSTPAERAALEQRIRDEHTDALIEFLRTRVEPNANVFVLVDQFEEIFAFRGEQEDDGPTIRDAVRWKERARRKAEAGDFVDLLIDLAARRELPIYVALTMRTDFLGECDLFYGLPEALNRGRYLVPRLTRQQLREAIEGPATLVGTHIEPRLLDYLLNALGDRFDRLPVLQHALLRTWDAWLQSGRVGPIDFPHYEAAGRLDRALDRDAEAALQGLDVGATSAIFKRLTDTDARQRRVRSQARVSELMATAGADRGTVEAIVRRFEEGGRSFVYTANDGLPEDPRVDIAHESLIRQWDRLRQWVDDERGSRDHFKELVARARKRERGEAALLQDPELRAVVDWRDQSHPSPAWAGRYSDADGDFASAASYLDASVAEQCHTLAEAELARRWKIWNPLILLVVLAFALLSADWLARSTAGAKPASHDTGRGLERAAAAAAPSTLAVTSTPAVNATPTVKTMHVGELEWTANDRGQAVDWNAAGAYCDSLSAGPRAGWRLPTTAELLAIYDPDPAAITPAGLKLKPPFRAGVGSRWIWSNEPGEQTGTAFAADFTGAVFVPLPVGFAGGARALCVLPPQPAGRAEELASRREGFVGLVRRNLPLGVFVLAYLVLASAGKRAHRWAAFPGILQSFVASGGRDPADARKGAETREAVAVHHTTYASTVRRITGYWIDTVVHLAAASLVFLVIIVIVDVPVAVTLPSGERIEGVLDTSDDQTVSMKTADGTLHSYPLTHGPSFDITGGVPVPAMLPSGARGEGRSFEKPHVVLTLPSQDVIEGTLDQLTADHLAVTTTDGAHQTFPLDPNTPVVDIQWPPSDAGILWALAFMLALGWLYESAQLSSTRQATLGMRAVGIVRTDLHGERLSFARASGWYGYRLLSYLAYLLGFVSQPFTKRRQTFHDWMAGSVVLRRPKPSDGRPSDRKPGEGPR